MEGAGRQPFNMAALLRLRLLTAQRGGEVQGAAWAEIDLKTGWWVIPADRSKNGLAHRVPLSPPAVKVLKQLAEERDRRAENEKEDPSPWVFPSPYKALPHIAHAQKAI